MKHFSARRFLSGSDATRADAFLPTEPAIRTCPRSKNKRGDPKATESTRIGDYRRNKRKKRYRGPAGPRRVPGQILPFCRRKRRLLLPKQISSSQGKLKLVAYYWVSCSFCLNNTTGKNHIQEHDVTSRPTKGRKILTFSGLIVSLLIGMFFGLSPARTPSSSEGKTINSARPPLCVGR